MTCGWAVLNDSRDSSHCDRTFPQMAATTQLYSCYVTASLLQTVDRSEIDSCVVWIARLNHISLSCSRSSSVRVQGHQFGDELGFKFISLVMS